VALLVALPLVAFRQQLQVETLHQLPKKLAIVAIIAQTSRQLNGTNSTSTNATQNQAQTQTKIYNFFARLDRLPTVPKEEIFASNNTKASFRRDIIGVTHHCARSAWSPAGWILMA